MKAHPAPEEDRLTREGLADVDAGAVIDHQAVLAWAESLGTERPLPLAAVQHALANSRYDGRAPL